MSTSFSTITNARVHTASGDLPVTDLAFSPVSGAVSHVACTRGGFLFGAEIFVSGHVLEGYDPAEQVWTATIDEAAMAAPEDGGKTTSIPLEDLPSTVVGPFGMTQSPILLATQFLELRERSEGADLPDRLERMGDWIGAAVFGPAGPLGTIQDFQVDPGALHVREMSLRVGKDTHLVPFAAIRSFVTDEGYAVTDLTEAKLEQGLTVAEPGPALPRQPRATWVPEPDKR